MLDGLVSADSIIAETTARQSTAVATPVLADTSRFVGLRIPGLPAISSSVRPNTVLTVPGIGRVTLHKVVRTPRSIEGHPHVQGHRVRRRGRALRPIWPWATATPCSP